MAQEYTIIDSFIVDGILNQRVQLRVPLEYGNWENTAEISVCATVTQKHRPQIHTHHKTRVVFPPEPNVVAYLQGGPGFPCAVPLSKSGYTKVLLDKGYQLVFYDQRGTGLSTPIETQTLQEVAQQAGATDENSRAVAQVEYLKNFRANAIVEDMEAVRRALIGASKWTLLGQLYGGFCSFTYLSSHLALLKEVYVTGGVPPIGFSADDVYRQTYQRTAERNAHYYRKYPQDEARVRDICGYLQKNRVDLPNGGVLSVERFQQLGLRFGGSGGTDGLHTIVTEFWHALVNWGRPTYAILNTIQNDMSFDTNVLYALFQEAIYCDGSQSSNWAASRLRFAPGNEKFVVSQELLTANTPVYFTGEMVYPSMFDDYAELVPLKELAHALHSHKKWSKLYDTDVLSKIQWEDVPVIAATYYSDQYVDFDITRAVKQHVFTEHGNANLRQYVTSEFFHNGLRHDPARVLGAMFLLRDCDTD